jgi:hypothetical protein
MKCRLILTALALTVLISSEHSISHAQSPSSSDKVSVQQPRKRKMRLGLVGYLLLPEGYKAYKTKDLRDAWYGYIVSPDNKIRIRWSSGLVQKPFDKGEDKFLWVKREDIPKGELKYGLECTDDGDMIVASVGWVNLYMPVKSDSDINTFLEIARSYVVEQCDDCERPLPGEPPSNNSFNPSPR